MAEDKVVLLVEEEEKRQAETISLIPSENYVSPAVRAALGSVFTNKYAEGYPGKRYYQGNQVVDRLEQLVCQRAQKLFGVPFVNVQPYSGSPANLAILAACCVPGDKILSQRLDMGGHLSMGQIASKTGEYYSADYYGLTPAGEINWTELESLAKKNKPRLIFCGGTAFTRVLNFSRFSKIADSIGALLVADVSHLAGLIAAGAHPSPVRMVDIIMTTTHKTLRGPRGAMIMVTKRGLEKDPDLGEKINRAVFPGLQGGPHLNNIAALGVALAEAAKPAFKRYVIRVVKNARVLAKQLRGYDFNLIGGGTKNHLLWIDLTNKGIDGWTAAWGLEAAGLIVNRQTIPFEPASSYYPSGIRLGTPAVTTRGMKEPQMRLIADWLNQVIEHLLEQKLVVTGLTKESQQRKRAEFKKAIFADEVLLEIKSQVKKVTKNFPLP